MKRFEGKTALVTGATVKLVTYLLGENLRIDGSRKKI